MTRLKRASVFRVVVAVVVVGVTWAAISGCLSGRQASQTTGTVSLGVPPLATADPGASGSAWAGAVEGQTTSVADTTQRQNVAGQKDNPESAPPQPAGRAVSAGKATGAAAAAQFRYQQRLSEDGSMPSDGILVAMDQRAQLAAYTERQRGRTNPAGLSAWTWLGPGNVGGRVRAISINQDNSKDILVGSVTGGIWRTLNAGVSWVPVNDSMSSLTITSLARDPANGNTVYASTGESFFVGDRPHGSTRGAGLFKSTNAGGTWTQLLSTRPPAVAPAAGSEWWYVNRLAINPKNPKHLLAATHLGLYEHFNAGEGPANTWHRRINTNLTDVEFSPDGATAVAGAPDGEVWYYRFTSTTIWRAERLGLGRVELTFGGPHDPNIAYASVGDLDGTATQSGLFISSSGGAPGSWVAVDRTTPFLCYQGMPPDCSNGDWNNALWVSPVFYTDVVVGGAELHRRLGFAGPFVRISADNIPLSAHVDQHVIVSPPEFDGTTTRTLYVGNDGGIWRTNDFETVSLTAGWASLNHGLGITQFYGGCVNTTGQLAGGTQDNGTQYLSDAMTPAVEGWTEVPEMGGDGGRCAFDPKNPNHLYGEYTALRIGRYSYSSNLYFEICQSHLDPGKHLQDAKTGEALFIAPIALDNPAPATPEQARFYAGGASLWRSLNPHDAASRIEWSDVKVPVIAPPIGGGPAVRQYISAIAVHPGNNNITWVGYQNGHIEYTANATAAMPAWINPLPIMGAPPRRFVTDIEILDDSNVFVTFSGYEPNNVWHAVKRPGGPPFVWDWKDLNTPVPPAKALPSIPINTIAIKPAGPCVTCGGDKLYIGTDVGVFASVDDGKTWLAANDHLANVEVGELFWRRDSAGALDYNTLYAATHGRGMYRATVAARSEQCTEPAIVISEAGASAQGNGVDVSYYIDENGLGQLLGIWDVNVSDVDTQLGGEAHVDEASAFCTGIRFASTGRPTMQSHPGGGWTLQVTCGADVEGSAVGGSAHGPCYHKFYQAEAQSNANMSGGVSGGRRWRVSASLTGAGRMQALGCGGGIDCPGPNCSSLPIITEMYSPITLLLSVDCSVGVVGVNPAQSSSSGSAYITLTPLSELDVAEDELEESPEGSLTYKVKPKE